MHVSVLNFFATALQREEIEGRRVLEVGSSDVNGSIAPLVKNCFRPAEYIGADLAAGPGVDVVCPAEELAERFGADSFDAVLSAEMLEHARDWRGAVRNMKAVCRPGGVLAFTTRSRGFKYHAWPHDFWRYEPEDVERIFPEAEILALERDPQDPGIFVKLRLPAAGQGPDLEAVELFSIVTGRRERRVEEEHFRSAHFRRLQRRLNRRARRKRWRVWRRRLWRRLRGQAQ
jgi:SAM-dependent methyltransferase